MGFQCLQLALLLVAIGIKRVDSQFASGQWSGLGTLVCRTLLLCTVQQLLAAAVFSFLVMTNRPG